MPTNNRNLTGSAHLNRSVDKASETALLPCKTAFCVVSAKAFLSQAAVNNCNANIRDLIPVPIAEHAKGSKPTGVEPKRDAASGLREQQTLKHCLKFMGTLHFYYPEGDGKKSLTGK
jgi:hypothetical protein